MGKQPSWQALKKALKPSPKTLSDVAKAVFMTILLTSIKVYTVRILTTKSGP